MSKRIFTKNQIEKLSQNEYVEKCGTKSIAFTKDFKLLAIKRYAEGVPPPEIFLEAGLNLQLLGRKEPKECLSRWRRISRTKGEIGFTEVKRGRPKKTTDPSDKSKIERLEAEIAYLKSANDFLIKLREKRAEQYSSRNKNTG